ncbi:D-alanyl-D-alanine carboxypeptidase family protein [Thioclava sp. GXIMD4216]|uniref:serine-type D-Ala-D-Ala carboxypeptidase n=1 Tax=Thioclava litoralis TaxID=3076557 RepID=A0ABZ1E1Z5_9RHOB|nr:D-alanyl-D-alanine carboxypeptidase family protein [Thioclava sp. FTW29]
MRFAHRFAALCLTVVTVLPFTAPKAKAFDTSASAAWVYDVSTKTVLMAKNADIPLPPASMSKLMTLDLLFEALRDGRVTMDTTFSVSDHAQSMGGSTMFLNTMDRPTVEELIHGIIINSGNDACVTVAEGLAGSESAFAEQMTERAHQLGMKNSMFANASGWPDPGQRMSTHDLGILATRIITEFPEYYKFFGMTEFNYKDRAPANAQNRNPLLEIKAADWTADGMKTGHTQEAGYGIVGSAHLGNRRIVFVLAGMDSETARRQEAEAVANWAFRQFVMKTVVTKGTQVARVPVWLGAQKDVSLVPAEDLELLVPATAQDAIKAEAHYTTPIEAPVKAGTKLGELALTIPGIDKPKMVDLVAGEDVAEGGFMIRIKTALSRLTAKALEAANS